MKGWKKFTKMRIYLAGPDVFLRDPLKIASIKKNICTKYGLQGSFPMDNYLLEEIKLADLNLKERREFAYKISKANEELMNMCDGIVANMTPFRGPSADIGTAYEMGYMRGQGKPVFAYSNETMPFYERTRLSENMKPSDKRDKANMSVENFGLTDNLMLDGGVLRSTGTTIVTRDVEDGYYTDLDAFEECIKKVVEYRDTVLKDYIMR